MFFLTKHGVEIDLRIKLTASLNGKLITYKEKKKHKYESNVISKMIRDINKRIQSTSGIKSIGNTCDVSANNKAESL